ncbi:MAG: hypothetical protein EOO13_15325 [Chitinophagaceae bacterium]|nr:MAG: hypothetical protein EOO13_15325 [Chitinophagaceae bacterium]
MLFAFSWNILFAQAPPKPYGALPSAAQLQWHEMEMYALIHFGVDTYTDKEWGYGDENPLIVNPVNFNAEKIVTTVKSAGFKGIIVVAKHHDGMCLWPTKTTSHNISKTNWKNGNGDMIKDYQLACNKLGIRLGLYCSPWDRNNASYGRQEYINIYREQLKELYSNYGPLFISWHDGANGGDGYYGGAKETRKIDASSYYGWDSTFALAHKMQPSAVIFGDIGPGVRWVGNEEGIAGETCWATYTPQAPDSTKQPANGFSKYWLATEGTKDGKYWMPAECDVPLRPGWFYHASQDDKVKSAKELLDIYFKSVGRGAAMDIGLAPNKEGQLHDNDVKSLKEFGKLLRDIFKNNLAKNVTFTATNIRGNNNKKYGPSFLKDTDRYSYWATDDEVLQASLLIDFKKQQLFNIIRLRENIKLGQRIRSFEIDAWQKNGWQKIASATSIGSNRLIRLPQHIRTSKLRLRITEAAASIALSEFSLFSEPLPITTHTTSSTNTIVADKDWKISTSSIATSNYPSGNAIDGNANTFLSTIKDSGSKEFIPQHIIIDLGKQLAFHSFIYLPAQNKNTEGRITKYSFFISNDGIQWQQIITGEFANIKANPVEQLVALNKTINARYIKLLALEVTGGNGITIAEIGIRE